MANCPGHGQGPGTPNPWDWFFKPCLLMCGDKCRACVGVVSISLAGGITALYARNLGACALTGPAVGFCIGLATTRFVYQSRKLGVLQPKRISNASRVVRLRIKMMGWLKEMVKNEMYFYMYLALLLFIFYSIGLIILWIRA